MLITTLGGLGIFLVGMIVMTDGLRALAGDTLRANLMRFTRTPSTGAAMGAICTAILQSSSATTVAAVGFVGAELMSFHNALGIIFGANLGSTITGWLVALVGFKLKLGMLALPIVFCGAVVKLFSSGKVAAAGLVLAGFGLIFVGISTLQQGMIGLQGIFDFTQLPGDTLIGRLQLVLLGIAFTIVTQASSLGVAATLTALFAGLIQWQQAAVLVIGMDIGTTVTAAMATIGGSIGARRTGLSHVIYNLCTGVTALLLVTPYMMFLEWLQPGLIETEAELALVGFHTTFNLIGVLLILPFTHQFALLMDRLIQATPSPYTHQLEPVLLKQPRLALNAVQESALHEYRALLTHLCGILAPDKQSRVDLCALQHALDETHEFLDQITTDSPAEVARLKALLHILDHLQRLHERCEEEEDRAVTARNTLELGQMYQNLYTNLPAIKQDIDDRRWLDAFIRANRSYRQVESLAAPYRESVANAIALGTLDVPEGTDRLEAIRWTRRVSKHIARINHHFEKAVLAAAHTNP
ncbi:MAG: Na/Pi symporter [Amphritea sp.]